MYGLFIASSASAFSAALAELPQMEEIVGRFYPGVDIGSAEGMLQLAFISFGLLMVGFAAAMQVSGWASDENERRLELILAAPITRFGWGGFVPARACWFRWPSSAFSFRRSSPSGQPPTATTP
ncbi:hypothetical protein BH23CHL9_BH23CHL9_04710 [soil metagenome]